MALLVLFSSVSPILLSARPPRGAILVDLDDLPSDQPAFVRVVQTHPYLSIATIFSVACIMLVKSDPGFKEKLKKRLAYVRTCIARTAHKMRQLVL